MKFRIGLLGCLICINAAAQSPAYVFEHFGYEQGLTASVLNIVKGKDGFLWMGTADGLVRFDGKNFTVYRNSRSDSLSLSNNIINGLLTDHKGNIWAATNGGLCYYDPISEVFHRVPVDFSPEKIDRYRIYAITESPRHEIWIATRTHFYKLNDVNQKKYSIPDQTDNLIIKNLLFDSHNRLWIGTNSGMFVYDESTGNFLHNNLKSPFSASENLKVSCAKLYPFKGDSMLAPTWYGGMQLLYISNGVLVNEPVNDTSSTDPRKHIVDGITSDSDGKIWIGTYGNGIGLYDMSNRKFTDHIHHDPSVTGSLASDYISALLTDETGIIWIGLDGGLDKYDPLTRQFHHVPLPVFTGEFSVYRTPSGFADDRLDTTRKWMWITVSGIGLLHYNRESMKFEVYKNNYPDSLPDNNLRAILYDNKNRLWIGSRTGVNIFDPASKSFRHIIFPDNVTPVSVNGMMQDMKGRFWYSTAGNGLYCYSENENKITSYKYIPGNSASLPDNFIFSMICDHEGMIWLGTQNNGICRLDPETGIFSFFMKKQETANGLPDNGVFDLYEDEQYNIWIATENGIACLNPVSGKLKVLTTEDGLSNNIVYFISRDNRNNFWFGTANGLCHYTPSENQFKNYFTNDGLGSNSMDGAVYRSGDMLYFGTSGNINYCNTTKLIMNYRPPPVVITGIKIFDKKLQVSVKDANPVKLNYRQSMITFEFAALNFTNSFLNKYEYMLEGYDQHWIPCGNLQSATYTNLSGGDYRFHVRAANNDGVWNETGAQLRLYISPPFWKTWWFYVLCFLTAAVILYSIYSVRVRQLLRLQQIRMRIARDLHDDIGSTLSSINMISSMAARHQNGQQKITENLKTISTASGMAMELMNDIVWSVNPDNDKMEMVFSRMRQYASGILEAAGIRFTLEMDDNCSGVSIPIEKRKDFYLIFKEAVNNLAKYSKATRAIVRVSYKNKMLRLEVTDNGNGIPDTKQFTGNGLKNMKARSATLKGDLAIRSNPGSGTTIDLKFPLFP